jgi:hypothetical protein
MIGEVSYAFEKLKVVLFRENCKEVVTLDVIKKFGLSVENAEKVVEEAFEMWSDAYVE